VAGIRRLFSIGTWRRDITEKGKIKIRIRRLLQNLFAISALGCPECLKMSQTAFS